MSNQANNQQPQAQMIVDDVTMQKMVEKALNDKMPIILNAVTAAVQEATKNNQTGQSLPIVIQQPQMAKANEPSAWDVITSPSEWPTWAKVAGTATAVAAVGGIGYAIYKNFFDEDDDD